MPASTSSEVLCPVAMLERVKVASPNRFNLALPSSNVAKVREGDLLWKSDSGGSAAQLA